MKLITIIAKSSNKKEGELTYNDICEALNTEIYLPSPSEGDCENIKDIRVVDKTYGYICLF
jgi:hypothetical protein